MSKKFLLSLSYLSLCKFFWTRTENRVIENRVMENRVKRGITVKPQNKHVLSPQILRHEMVLNITEKPELA